MAKRFGNYVRFDDYTMPWPSAPETEEHLKSQAMAYRHFVSHPAGTESMIRQLREVRRELRRLERDG